MIFQFVITVILAIVFLWLVADIAVGVIARRMETGGIIFLTVTALVVLVTLGWSMDMLYSML
jgi:hypothetical protein